MTYTLHYHLCSLQELLTLIGQEHGLLLDGLHTAHMKETHAHMDFLEPAFKQQKCKQHDENSTVNINYN